MRALRGKTAVITGAASGIGRALALRLHRAGMRLVLADIDRQGVNDLARQIPGSVPVHTDVSRAAQVDALAETAYRASGAVHLLCNNAGIADSGPIWEMPLARLRRVIDVDLWGAIHGCRAFVPRMLHQGGESHVVNVSSMAGLVTPPGASAYSIAKHGVVALSEALAQDLEASGARIGVSVVCPGWVRTSLGDKSRDPVMRALIAGGTDAAHVADEIVAAVREGRFYVLTHPELAAAVRNRARDIALGRRPSVPLVRRPARRRARSR